MKHRKRPEAAAGFTLVEVIATIVVIGLMSTFVLSFFNDSIKQSAVPIAWMQHENTIHNNLEDVTNLYVEEVNSVSSNFDLSSFQGQLGNYTTSEVTMGSFSGNAFSTSGSGVLFVKVQDADGQEYLTLYTDTRNRTQPFMVH